MGDNSVAIGHEAARYPMRSLGPYNTSSFVAIGKYAGYDTTYLGGAVVIGEGAGCRIQNTRITEAPVIIGYKACGNYSIDETGIVFGPLVGSGVVAIGPKAAYNGCRFGLISIGSGANGEGFVPGTGNSSANAIAIGVSSISDCGDECIAIGSNVTLKSNAGGFAPAVAIGNNMNIDLSVSDATSGFGPGFYTNAVRDFGHNLKFGPSDPIVSYRSDQNSSGVPELLAGQMQTSSCNIYLSPFTSRYTVYNGGPGIGLYVDVANYTLDGTTSFSYKTFVIDHPKKPDNYLVHACLEGPEAGVYYRGKTQVHDKFVEVTLPDYVDALAKDFTVHVTPIFDEDNDIDGNYKVTEVKDGKFRIYGPRGRVNWIVYGSRGDIEVEPEKSKTNVNGDGPYKWI